LEGFAPSLKKLGALAPCFSSTVTVEK